MTKLTYLTIGLSKLAIERAEGGYMLPQCAKQSKDTTLQKEAALMVRAQMMSHAQ